MIHFNRLYLEITNTCNLSCRFCPGSNRPGRFMDPNQFSAALNKAQGHFETLYLHVLGEPLLHPGLESILAICSACKTKVIISTNGTLLFEKGELIKNHAAIKQVHISLHCRDDIQNEELRKDCLEQVFKFIRTRNKCIGITLKLWNLPTNGLHSFESKSSGTFPFARGISQNNPNALHETPRHSSISSASGAKRLNQEVLAKIQKEFSLPDPITAAETPFSGIKILDNVYLKMASTFEWPGLAGPIIGEKGFCHGLRNQAAILVDGTVVPCCLDKEGAMALGNIFKDSFEAIVGSPRARAMYDGFSKRTIMEELCKRCSYRKRFD
jgi:radical SAM protein with 4Fe4S-binding SPASM domain